MAGMEGAFCKWNVCAVASGVGIRIADCDSIAFIGITSGAASATLLLSATLAGSYVVPSGWAPIVHYYTDTSNGAGTAIWSDKIANNAAADPYHGSGSVTVPYTGTISNGTSFLFTVLASMVPVGYEYIKCTGTNATIIAISDPIVQRASRNMPAMSA
jgi:hypothetical protein